MLQMRDLAGCLPLIIKLADGGVKKWCGGMVHEQLLARDVVIHDWGYLASDRPNCRP